ncbi:MAG: TM2 domain-containing protein [Gammaproteobacteria bacterium]|nr:TM2 domain-containing protein [Gammaproteobacteria bacterium]
MSRAWQRLDLEGAGLQTLNRELTRRLKRRGVAYGAWALFPLGAHRVYLEERIGAAVYAGLTAAALTLGLTLGWWAALGPALVEGGLAVFDLLWIERRRVTLNKALRKTLYLGHGARPPRGYRGRLTGDESYLEDYVRLKEHEEGGAQATAGGQSSTRTRAPSFLEQEAVLRELGRAKDEQRRRDDEDETQG